MFGVILFALAVYLFTKNISLKNENEELKKHLNHTINFCPRCGYDLYNTNNNVKEDINIDEDLITNDKDLY